jgi:hypothetical protein
MCSFPGLDNRGIRNPKNKAWQPYAPYTVAAYVAERLMLARSPDTSFISPQYRVRLGFVLVLYVAEHVSQEAPAKHAWCQISLRQSRS